MYSAFSRQQEGRSLARAASVAQPCGHQSHRRAAPWPFIRLNTDEDPHLRCLGNVDLVRRSAAPVHGVSPAGGAGAGAATASAACPAAIHANPACLPRLLVVDDDLGVIQHLGSLLAGFAGVSFATNGADAVAMVRAQRPDLVLLDAEMPGLSGFDVCKALKADLSTRQIPVLFITSHVEVDFEVAALRMGAVDFLRKPLEPVQVLARLRLHLRPPAAGLAEHAGSERLLIIDDNAAEIELLRQMLQGLGECHFALDAEHALQLAPMLQPDLILLDTNLPGTNGFTLCTRLKAHPALRHVPVVFLTKSKVPGHEPRALSLGADDYLVRPYDAEVLRARVGRLIARKHTVDADLEAVRQQSLRVSDARVAALVADASDCIVAADAQGRIVLANAAACLLSGCSERELLGRPLPALLSAGGDTAMAGAPMLRSGPGRLKQRDGTAVDVELAVSVVGSGADALQAVIVHDLRERQRREAADRLLLQAQASRSAMRSTLSFIAHEMGNPLNAISGFTQLMQASAADTPLSAHARHLALMASASAELTALMRDVVDLARLESGQLGVQMRAVELGSLLRLTCEQIAADAALVSVIVELALPDAPLHAVADARRLAQCVGNLLSNALKYGQTAGRVLVELHADGDRAVLSVTDHGRGMSPEQMVHLFEPYNRLGAEASGVPGSGLGLALTRELVQAMGGVLAVDSREGEGTRFSIGLARCAAAES